MNFESLNNLWTYLNKKEKEKGVKQCMGRIRPMASAFQAWRPAHAMPGRARDARSVVVTAQWPRARRRFGVTGAVGAEVQAR
jgi:hypothetical protein